MKLKIKNFGPIANADINIKKLTLLFGPNNCGKTYLSYAIWGLINNIVEESIYPISPAEIKAFTKKGILKYNLNEKSTTKMFEMCIENYKKSINRIFNCSEDYFKDVEIIADNIDVDNNLSGENKTMKLRFGDNNYFTITLGVEGANNFATLTSDNNDIDDTKIPSKVLVEILRKIIAKAHLKPMFKRAFSITSERTGVTLFYKNLDYNKSDAIDYILKLKDKKINPFTLFDKITSRYAMPIQKNIDFIRDYENRSKKMSFILKEKEKYTSVLDAWAKVVGGSFTNNDDSIIYKIKSDDDSVPLHLSSSATKSLFIIDAYLKHEIEHGDIVFIDEPELNLSPKNQVNMAQFLIELVKIGIGVFITTHSDYIVREINIFILNNKSSLFKNDDIALYTFDDDNNFSEINIDEDGFSVSLFDEVISSQIERANS